MARHSHKFTIGDEDAVRALVDKLVGRRQASTAPRETPSRARRRNPTL